ncbi:MAG: hypothetical protein JTT11_02365 [Candidatus Brockarchaeota archaeon]|nr:hypothetical protein [Candidatus Brockarchaeota archaeon]
MNERSIDFLKQTFSRYYSSLKSLWVPEEIEKREFGFFLGKEKAMVRHRSFDSAEKLLGFLAKEAPFDVYYSIATYDSPQEAMSEKGWRGADVVFDIDADHLGRQCREEHDMWVCLACGKEGKGGKPASCPECEKKDFHEVNWVCGKCLEVAKLEVYKLLEVLEEDFGIGDENVEVYFSGHRGYHVHVQGRLSSIDQAARKELVDYLTGTGLDLGLVGLGAKSPGRLVTGWGTRIARSLYEIVNEKGIGEKHAGDKNLEAKRKRRILEGLMANDVEALSKNVSKKDFESLVSLAIEKVSVKVDPVVTTDVHRLFRLPETINSKTGLLKRRVPLESLSSFDPLEDAVVLKGDPVKVSVKRAPRFSLSGGTYGPYANESATVPREVAVLLLCKEAAEYSG